jgi:hypothetical protein
MAIVVVGELVDVGDVICDDIRWETEFAWAKRQDLALPMSDSDPAIDSNGSGLTRPDPMAHVP